MTTQPASPSPNSTGRAVYGAFWRWHFYAGLVVMPVLMLMALTGGLYLFKDEIEGALNKPLLEVPAAVGATSPSAWGTAALGRVPGRMSAITLPADGTHSAKVTVEAAGGSSATVYVDPHTASVLGATTGPTLMDTVKRLHSLDIAGPVFNLLVEIIAGWSIVMVATGVVLWWPRGRASGVVTVRGTPTKRVFWRDLHAVTGIFIGAVIVFLAATGMPWSAVWGQQVRKLTTEAGWGRPALPMAVGSPAHGPDHQAPAAASVPWALQETSIHSAHHPHQSLGLDQAVTTLEAAGLRRPYTVVVPADPQTAWSASTISNNVHGMRTVYLDSGTGEIVADVAYRQFGPAAKAIEWGIAVHQGQQYGLANKLIMLLGCLSIWLLGVSGLVMWWKRRPIGRLAAPPRPATGRAYVDLIVVVLPLAVIYPLVAASLAVVLAADVIIRRWQRPRVRTQ